jgi:hypothetical protein
VSFILTLGQSGVATEVVLEDMGIEENGAKAQVAQE